MVSGMRLVARKRVGLMTVALLLMLSGGIAVAYWTAGGSGSGTAATGTVTGLTVKQTSTITGMAPGDSPQTLSGNFDNSNSGPVYATSVTVSIASVTKAGGAPAGTCDSSDYTLSGTTMPVGAQVPSGTGVGSWSGATIQFNNKSATNQDGCKNATVQLAYTVS